MSAECCAAVVSTKWSAAVVSVISMTGFVVCRFGTVRWRRLLVTAVRTRCGVTSVLFTSA